jgi:hypothetical protein
VISAKTINTAISVIMALPHTTKPRFSGTRFPALALIVISALTACGSEPAPPVYIPTLLAPSSEAPLIYPGLEQAADDYVDAVMAGEPNALYDMAAMSFTDVVDRQAFVAGWKRCHPDTPERYDVVTWTAQGGQAVVATNADGVRGLLELRHEGGRWRWVPVIKDICP